MNYTVSKGKRRDLIIFASLTIFSLFATWYAHKGRERFDWLSEMWADKSGYYIYLPATFMYQWDYEKIPKDLDAKNGWGFVIDHNNQKIYTHFYYGESILLSPFFFATRAACKIMGRDEEAGFAYPFHRIFNFAAVFYFMLGVWFLNKFLRRYFSRNLSWFVILITFFGTNLMFYTLEDTLMSHVYSFSIGSVFLYFAAKFIDDRSDYFSFLRMAFPFALMVVIRPTNGIIALAYLFLDLKSGADLWRRILDILHPKRLLPAVLMLAVLAFPQLLYWKYLTGKFSVPDYGGAGFGNWQEPRFAQVWFSTVNGLFTWSPVLLFFVVGMIYMLVKKIPNGIFVLAIFLITSYIAAAWKNWYWGCAFGHRSFVEYYCLFTLPFGFLMQDVFRQKKKFLNVVVLILVAYTTYFSFMLTTTVMRRINGKCFFGSTWDFGEYSRVLNNAGVLWPVQKSNTYTLDYENEEQGRSPQITDRLAHSGLYSLRADASTEFIGKYSAMIWDFGNRYPSDLRVKVMINKPAALPTHAMIVCCIDKDGKNDYWKGVRLDEMNLPAGSWSEASADFSIPPGIPGDHTLRIYIWNPGKTVFYIDDWNIRFKP
jgi:hypothetical protein